MTSKSKTMKSRDTVLGRKNRAATTPKKSRKPATCGYFDCDGCEACADVDVSAGRVAARRISGDSDGCLPVHAESPGAAARPATPSNPSGDGSQR